MGQQGWVVGYLEDDVALAHPVGHLDFAHWQILAVRGLHIFAILEQSSDVFYADVAWLTGIWDNYDWLSLVFIDLRQLGLLMHHYLIPGLPLFDIPEHIPIGLGGRLEHLLGVGEWPLEPHHPVDDLKVYIIDDLLLLPGLFRLVLLLVPPHHPLVDLNPQFVVDGGGRIDLSVEVREYLFMIGDIHVLHAELRALLEVLDVVQVLLGGVEEQPEGT